MTLDCRCATSHACWPAAQLAGCLIECRRAPSPNIHSTPPTGNRENPLDQRHEAPPGPRPPACILAEPRPAAKVPTRGPSLAPRHPSLLGDVLAGNLREGTAQSTCARARRPAVTRFRHASSCSMFQAARPAPSARTLCQRVSSRSSGGRPGDLVRLRAPRGTRPGARKLATRQRRKM